MQWKKERDLLIAQTLAFVQSMAGKNPDAGKAEADAGKAEATPDVEAPIRAIESLLIETVEPPREAEIKITVSRPVIASDFRAEMQARVASFRAHQQRFHSEREAYFNATLAKARAAIENAAAPSRE
jgi:hypothetical protein